MTRDSAIKWLVIVAAVLLDVILLGALDLNFDLPSLIRPIGFAALLTAVGLYYRWRSESNFVLCVNALLHLVLFSSSYTILMYCLATFNNPLIDPVLVDIDARLGCHLPAVVSWAKAHPTVERVLHMAYDTLLPQTALIAALGLVGDRRPLEAFVKRFMLSALLTAAVFYAYPAAGPFEAYGYELNDAQARYMAHLEGLRAGDMDTISLHHAEGLITFPSFHATWAILLALGCWHRRRLFALSSVLNGMVVIATLTTGWHYLTDVFAGMIVAVVAIGACHWLDRWIYRPSATVESALPSEK
jgi:hypothetical protein